MAKKHRVKRQNYVQHLIKLEKDREAYLVKRRAPKRSREMRNNEEVTGEGRDMMESKSLKKRRTELAAEERNDSDEEVQQRQQPPLQRASSHQKAADNPAKPGAPEATNKSSSPAAPSGERAAFFAAPSFSALVNAPTKAMEKTEAERSTNTKKSLKRRHY